MKKAVPAATLIILISTVSAFNASLIERDSGTADPIFDRTSNTSEYYSSFPQEFNSPESIGSYSYKDDSLLTPDLVLNISGKNSTLYGEKIQLFYSSISGNLTQPILNHAARIDSLENGYTTLDVEFSSFTTLYPGKIFLGFVNRSNTSYRPENLTELKGTIMNGSFELEPTIYQLEDRTRIWLKSASDRKGDPLHANRSLSRDVLVTVKEDSQIILEERTKLGENMTVNFSFDGDEKVFVNSLLSLDTAAVDPCESVQGNGKYFIINESIFNADPDHTPAAGNDSCVTIHDSENSVVDFANNTIDGTINYSDDNDDCGLMIMRSDNLEIKNSRVTQFNRGVCILNSESTTVQGTHTTGNDVGVLVDNSTPQVMKMKLRNNLSELKSRDTSDIEFARLNLSNAEISGRGKNLSLNDVSSPPPEPNGTLEVGQWIDIQPTGSKGQLNKIGFHYDNSTEVNPRFIYKIDSSGGSYQYKNLSKVVDESEKNFIYSTKEITGFSVFAPYGKETSENDSEEGGGTPGGGGGGGGGGGSGGGGGGGGLPGLGPGTPSQQEVLLNLTLENEHLVLQQGETGNFSFRIENYGEVESPEVHVSGKVKNGWDIGRKDFQRVSPGTDILGSLLLEVYQNEVPGNYSVPVEVRNSNGTVYDRESLEVVVEPRETIRDLRVLEGPNFLTLRKGSDQEIAFLLENTGDFNLDNIRVETRNLESCIDSVKGSHNLEKSKAKSVEYKFDLKDSQETCTGLIVFSSDKSEKLAINPVKIRLMEPTLLERNYILPLIVLLWTILTIIWTWRLEHER